MIQRAGPVLTLRRDFSARERAIAELIGDELSYAEIGAALSPPLSAHTVRVYVIRMAQKIDQKLIDNTRALPPRTSVYMLVQHERWERTQYRKGAV